jgi:hypothetical protein
MPGPKFDIPKLTTLVKDMAQDLIDGKGYDSKYDYIKENIPAMYDMLVEDPVKALPNLLHMLKLAAEIKDEKTQEDQSKKVGLFLADQYIYPNIDMTNETKPEV